MAISLNNVNTRLTALEKKKFGHVFPDYSKAIKLANSSSGYKPPSNGFMSFDLFDDKAGTTWITVNSIRFFQQKDVETIEGTINVLLPVTTSDTIAWYYHGLYHSCGIGVYFIPAKIL